MPYQLISSFKAGMDRRRPKVIGAQGSLWRAENVVLSRGGDIEKAKRFVSAYTLPSGTFGLAPVNGALQVYATSSKTVPAGVTCQVLTVSGSPGLERILDVKVADGKPYVIAKFDNGDIHHFYDGSRISGWDSLAAGNASRRSVATFLAEEMQVDDAVIVNAIGDEILVTAKVAGTPFTLTAAATDGGSANDQTATVTAVTANVVAVANVDAFGTVTITGGSAGDNNKVTSITVDGTELLSAPVPFSTSNTATAAAVAQRINNTSGTHGYTAVAASNVITITAAALTGADENGNVVTVTTEGDVTATKADMGNGVDAVAAVAQVSKVAFGGTFEALDLFTVTLNGTAYKVTGRASAHGTSAMVYKRRIYVAAYNVIRYSQIDDFDDFTDATASSGAGFFGINVDGRITTLAAYQNNVAVFTRANTEVFFLDTDSDFNASIQIVPNTGTDSPHSVASYGNLDVFYLDDTGLRSLQPRDSSNTAIVNDVGTIIDDYVLGLLDTYGADAVRRAKALVDPTDGRYWLAIGEEILLFTNFPSAKINGWTVLQPGFTVSELVRLDRRVFVRSADTVYLYGGANADQYVASGEAVVELPFTGTEDPAAHKTMNGIDVVLSGGVWKLEMLTDPDEEVTSGDAQNVIEIGRFRKTTYNYGKAAMGVKAAIAGWRLTELTGDSAKLCAVAFHYDRVK